MDSIKFLDEIIAYQQHKDDKYPVKEHTLTQLSIRVNKNMQDNINSLMAEHGINDAMFMLMSLLSTSDNFCMSPSDISNVLQFSKTNVTRISDSLVTKGFIRRVDSRNDRRSKYIHLTP
ncbi:TPA: MarR family transcriptional regulator, partial [Escherichia coli]